MTVDEIVEQAEKRIRASTIRFLIESGDQMYLEGFNWPEIRQVFGRVGPKVEENSQ